MLTLECLEARDTPSVTLAGGVLAVTPSGLLTTVAEFQGFVRVYDGRDLYSFDADSVHDLAFHGSAAGDVLWVAAPHLSVWADMGKGSDTALILSASTATLWGGDDADVLASNAPGTIAGGSGLNVIAASHPATTVYADASLLFAARGVEVVGSPLYARLY